VKTDPAEAARKELLGALSDMRDQRSGLMKLLESIGRLELLEPGRAPSLVTRDVLAQLVDTLGAPVTAETLSSVGLEGLAVEVLAALDAREDAVPTRPDLDSDAEDRDPGDLEPLERALEARDRVELALLGAEAMVGSGALRLDDELAAELDAFESLLRPELWRLTVTNEDRARPLAFVPPPLRDRFWWRFDGVDVDPRAADALPAVASLVARYPEARDELERLIDAERIWRSAEPTVEAVPPVQAPVAAPQPADQGRVTSLADWVARKTRRGSPAAPPERGTGGRGVGEAGDDEPALALAAAPPDAELPLLERPEVELSFRAPGELLVDVIADRDAGRAPSLRQEDGRVTDLVPVPDTLERFSIMLDRPLLDAAGVVLRVPLVGGMLEIRLPPEEE